MIVIVAAASEALPPPEHFSSVGWLIVGLAGVMTIVKSGLDLWKDHFREEPRPAGTYATISHVEKQVNRLDGRIDACHNSHQKGDADLDHDIQRLGAKIDEVKNSLQAEGSRRAASLHSRIDDISQKLSAVSERSESSRAELSLMNQNLLKILTEVRK